MLVTNSAIYIILRTPVHPVEKLAGYVPVGNAYPRERLHYLPVLNHSVDYPHSHLQFTLLDIEEQS